MNIVLKIWQKIAPEKLLVFIRFLIEPEHYKKKRIRVLDFFLNKDLNNQPSEIAEGVKFLRFHKFSSLPYKWTLKYESYVPDVYRDNVYKCYYIDYFGKRLYFPKQFTKNQVIWGTRSILKEQDINSPHLYLTQNFKVDDNSIIVDGGVAEGNFSLSVVEKAKKLYLIECDPEWIEALKLTFKPWENKVVFVNKFLGGNDSENSVTIDTLLYPYSKENYFIKMDIEGYEIEALAGIKNLVQNNNSLKMNICAYHRIDDLVNIEKILKNYGFQWEVSNGYLLYFHEDEEPSFRKAIVRAAIK